MLFYNETYLHSRHKPDQYSSAISMGKLFRPSRREAFNFSHRWIDNFEVKFVKLYLWKIWKADFDDGHLNKERVIFCYRTYCRKMPQSTFIFTDAYNFPLYLDVAACIKKTVYNCISLSALSNQYQILPQERYYSTSDSVRILFMTYHV